MTKKKQKELPLSSLQKYAETSWHSATPHSLYRWIFPEGELDACGAYTKGMYCGIAVTIHYEVDLKKKQTKTTARRHWIYNDLAELDKLVGDSNGDFTLFNGISYAGKTRKAKNARYCYAIIIDVDYIKRTESSLYPGEPIGLVDMEHQIEQGFLPEPTAIVLSGSGIHVYYILDDPIPMFQRNVQELQRLKDALTRKWWMHGLVQQSSTDVQIQSVHQAFRVPGTKTKDGRRATAWWVRGEKTTIEELNRYVEREDKANIDMLTSSVSKGSTPIAEAKEKWPDWYQRRVIEGRPRQTWVCKRSVYEWWLRRLREGATSGHRYWCVMVLAVYGIKCLIPKDEVEADAIGLVRYLDSMTTEQTNHFSVQDVKAAMKAYNPDYITYPIHAIVARTGIHIEKNKRNYRKQSAHLVLARTMQHTRAMLGEDVLGGRPKGSGTKQQLVQDYFLEHPGASVLQASQELGISRPTVYKWRNS